MHKDKVERFQHNHPFVSHAPTHGSSRSRRLPPESAGVISFGHRQIRNGETEVVRRVTPRLRRSRTNRSESRRKPQLSASTYDGRNAGSRTAESMASNTATTLPRSS